MTYRSHALQGHGHPHRKPKKGPVVQDHVAATICAEVIRRLKEDTAEEWGFNSIFHEAAKASNIFHGDNAPRYNSIFRQAITKANAAVGKLAVQKSLERGQKRPSNLSPEQAYAINQRMSGERDD